MDYRRPAWHTAQLADQRPMPLVVLRTPMGDRVWGLITHDVGQALGGGYFDADVAFDSDLYLDADGIILEQSGRLLDLGDLASSLRPVDGGLLGSYTASERPTMSVEVHNGDRAMSRMIGQEYVLGQQLVAYAIFPSLDVTDAMPKRTAHVTTWTLTRRSLRLEAEEI